MAQASCLTYSTVFENSENFGFVVIFPKKFFFNFGGKNHKILKIRDSHFVDLDILHMFCILCTVSLKTVPLMDSQTFATFCPKIAEGDVTKVAITQQLSDEI